MAFRFETRRGAPRLLSKLCPRGPVPARCRSEQACKPPALIAHRPDHYRAVSTNAVFKAQQQPCSPTSYSTFYAQSRIDRTIPKESVVKKKTIQRWIVAVTVGVCLVTAYASLGSQQTRAPEVVIGATDIGGVVTTPS